MMRVQAGLISLAALVLAAAPHVDDKLPAYSPVEGASGSIKCVGSDTMVNLMTHWGEGFKKHHPGVAIEVEGKGSGTAPVALVQGTATIGQMSREMKPSEIDAFEKAKGFAPTRLPVAIDMLAIFVHKDNPIESLSMEQLDSIFSKNRKRDGKAVATWGDLGLTGAWANKPISMYGRNAASGTYGYFKEHVLKNGDYKDEVKEQPGSSAVVQGVASDEAGIGYSGIGYKTSDVKVVPLVNEKTEKVVEALAENAYTGKYPLSRFLFLYVAYDPKQKLDPLRTAFLSYVYSHDGQTDVVRDGFLPVPAPVAQRYLKTVGLGK